MASVMKSAGKANASSEPGGPGVADLGRRHRARVEPGVDHRLDPAGGGHGQRRGHVPGGRPGRAGGRGHHGALGARELHLVDGRTVRVDVAHVAPGQLGELGQRADAEDVAVVAPPDGKRGAPVAVARERPVDVVLQPLPEPPVADVGGVPVDGPVGRQQVGLAGRGGHVPAGLAPVDEGRPAPPAVRVGVDVGLAAQQQPVGLQPVVDVVVGLRAPPARTATRRPR